MAFLKRVREKLKVLHLKDELLNRAVNEGFSGGEKKRNEIFQMALLEPALGILDETDSGLDIIEQALVMRDDDHGAVRRTQGVDAVSHHTECIDIKA